MSEYERGWNDALQLVREEREVRYAEQNCGGAYALSIAVGMMTCIMLFAFGTMIGLHGIFDPWFFMLSLGGATWFVYLRQAGARDVAEARAKRAEFEKKWPLKK